MYSGISGLKNFQTKLDVIGNNIANVNTYGFKKGRTVFKDLISQTTSGASGPTGSQGGVNAKQVGLGSQLAAIDTIHSGGSLQSTGNTLDLAISGDGFFQVAAYDAEEEAMTNIQYTRAGNFYMDNQGYLVNSDGGYLVGVSDVDTSDPANITFTNAIEAADGTGGIPDDLDPADATQFTRIVIPTTAQSMSIGQDGTVTFVDQAGVLKFAGKIVMGKFSNPGGLEKTGSNYYQESSNSGAVLKNFAGAGGNGSINSGFLEMSNVDLSEEFTDMIVAQRGFQANTRIITTSDSILEELINLKR